MCTSFSMDLMLLKFESSSVPLTVEDRERRPALNSHGSNTDIANDRGQRTWTPSPGVPTSLPFMAEVRTWTPNPRVPTLILLMTEDREHGPKSWGSNISISDNTGQITCTHISQDLKIGTSDSKGQGTCTLKPKVLTMISLEAMDSHGPRDIGLKTPSQGPCLQPQTITNTIVTHPT